jgi:hypothetical protein
MFDLKPNLLSPEEQLAVDQFEAIKEARIEEIVVDLMLDPISVFAALEALIRDSATTRGRMVDLIMGHGDKGINIANLKLDCMDWLRERVKEGE